MAAITERIRAFIAVGIEPDTARAIGAFIAELGPGARGVSWVNPDNVHLTVRFLGNAVERARIEPLTRVLGDVARRRPAFRIAIRGTGAFPNLSRPRVLWAGVESADLARLADDVERAAVEAGFEPESRAFSPHLTLGRVRDFRWWPDLRKRFEQGADRDFGVSLIGSMAFYRSRLFAKGANYEPLASFSFDAGMDRAV